MLPEAAFSLVGNEFFTAPASTSVLSDRAAAAARLIVNEINGGLKKDGDVPIVVQTLHAARNAFQQRGNREAAQLVDNILSHISAVETDEYDRERALTRTTADYYAANEFRRELAERFGVYLNLRRGGSGLGPSAAVATETMSLQCVDGKTHRVILLETGDRTGNFGAFEVPSSIFINEGHAKAAKGLNPLSGVIANELAHSFLTSHGFTPRTGHTISLAEFRPRTEVSAAVRDLCDAMRERAVASPVELHELFSDCWSTAQTPSFDRERLLEPAISRQALSRARVELDKPVEPLPYDLTHEMFVRFLTRDLAENSRSTVLTDTLQRMYEHEKSYIRYQDRIDRTEGPLRRRHLLNEQKAVAGEWRQIRSEGLTKIRSLLGQGGLERQRQTYSEFGAVLLDFIRSQPEWHD